MTNKIKMISLAVSFILCLFLTSRSQAQTAAAYLKMDAGARAAAMGGAFVAIADDATAASYNPAGISLLSSPSFSTMTANLGMGQKHTFLSAVYPFSKKQSAAFSWVRATSGSGASFITPAGTVSAAEEKQDAYILSYAMGFKKNLMLGINLKLLRDDLTVATANGTSFDIGALYTLPQGITLGLNLQDIGGKIKYSNGTKDKVDFLVKFGGSYKFMQDKLLAALAFDFGVDSGDKKTLTHFGLEYYPLPETKMLALRAGYDDKFFTTGIGVNFRGLGVDYSYRNKSDVGDSIQRVSVMYQLMKY